MIFLIEYNRKKGMLETFKSFEDSEDVLARSERLKLELKLNENRVMHEVVLMQADSEADLRKTHSRYFKTPKEMIESFLNP
jgi:hypothetical protein